MRVISQDGRIDIPYDNFVVGITNDNYIVASRNIADPPGVFAQSTIAKYSTREKAIKAMEMLREKYLKYMKVDGGADLLKGGGYVQPNIWNVPKIFQFPQEDEIEV
jgi:hypothetical protein